MVILQNKNAIITGTNRGIGNQIVRTFAQEGCSIWACARKKTDEFEEELRTIGEENGVRIEPLYFDMTDYQEMKSAVSSIQKSKIPVDVLVNCAGILSNAPFQMTSSEEFRKVYDVNFFASVELTRLVVKLMTRQKKGAIVNIGSVSGLDPHPANTAYGSSKAALLMFTQILASEVAGLGIRVNAIAPGNTDTEMIRPVRASAGDESMFDITAMGRFATPHEIAEVAAFLASERSSFINGEIIRVDGGRK